MLKKLPRKDQLDHRLFSREEKQRYRNLLRQIEVEAVLDDENGHKLTRYDARLKTEVEMLFKDNQSRGLSAKLPRKLRSLLNAAARRGSVAGTIAYAQLCIPGFQVKWQSF